MKLIIKFNGSRHRLSFGNEVQTLGELKNLISSQISGLPSNYLLSLNGSTSVGDDNTSVGEIGFVYRDIVHVVCNSGGAGGGGESGVGIQLPCMSRSSNTMDSSHSSAADCGRSLIFQSASTVSSPLSNNEARPEQNSQLASSSPSSAGMPDLLMESLKFFHIEKKPKLPAPEKSFGVLIHFLMTEMGFRSIEKGTDNSMDTNDDDHFNMQFYHINLTGLTFEILVVKMFKRSLVHGFVMKEGRAILKQSMQVELLDYVHADCDVDGSMFKLDRLVLLRKHFRDSIINPIYQFALRELGLPCMPELTTLPYDIQMYIVKMLDIRSLLNLSETSSVWRQFCTDNIIWKKKYRECFGHIHIDEADWFQLYKKAYSKSKERPNAAYHRSYSYGYPRIWPGRGWEPRPDPSLAQSIIGGDYDLFPLDHVVLPGIGRPPFHHQTDLRRDPRLPHFPPGPRSGPNIGAFQEDDPFQQFGGSTSSSRNRNKRRDFDDLSRFL